ncbi:hypothetical protein [Shewanella fidelis]|uniref:Adhesin n=1 Tax=Shewanella fidelis TaxID=173509 RepID=A0AAW8NPZ3_9GAMM|nr:hypothetical protein [Shewanella fidelis]MDR8525197.1 hypothetical protein [Shewanella fidelis]MDW4811268.1 hypothetical protein [Shewanella fidelis]MDW4814953.1 hypothetical protein [Shewanella fidelis]MDW4819043.1 hypothetical protein [Shewanella fidelis]MDW4823280.1 hypothetical protein [Shewanella fidelis]
MEMKKLTLVMCIGAAISAPAFAGGNNDATSNSESDSSVSLTKEVKVKKDLEYKGTVKISGDITANGLGMAVVDNVQASGGNLIGNHYLENDASIGDAAFGNASGNIGVNQAAGDFNVQGNSAALASIDASFAFGSGDAEIFSSQRGTFTGTNNYASTNTATIDGEAFMGASGNIGVNIAAGGNNVQANNMAASAFQGRLGEASVSNNQVSAHNGIRNESVVQNTVDSVDVRLGLRARGSYSGSSEQTGSYYPEIWQDDGSHANGDSATLWGHIDMDSENPTGDSGLSFDEQGTVGLRGVVSGQLPIYIETLTQKTTNTASLAGNAFNGASGNIGVNMASGHGNLQSNNLSLTSMAGGAIVSEAP